MFDELKYRVFLPDLLFKLARLVLEIRDVLPHRVVLLLEVLYLVFHLFCFRLGPLGFLNLNAELVIIELPVLRFTLECRSQLIILIEQLRLDLRKLVQLILEHPFLRLYQLSEVLNFYPRVVRLLAEELALLLIIFLQIIELLFAGL